VRPGAATVSGSSSFHHSRSAALKKQQDSANRPHDSGAQRYFPVRESSMPDSQEFLRGRSE